MTLEEVIDRINALSGEATIYAEKPWSGASRAVVVVEPEHPVPVEAVGLDYFLEVDIAQEVAALAAPDARLESVIYYAENDAYPAQMWRER
jgi:hypothetical protein